jgi:hypothetical protein
MRDLRPGDLVCLENGDHGRVVEYHDGICKVRSYGVVYQKTCWELTLIED